VLDTTHRSLTHGGEPVPISATLFDMLLYLVRHPDRIVTKSELLDAVWPTKTVEEANVSQTVFALRKALAASGATEAVIGTAPGQGYRLVAPVRPIIDPAAAPAAGLPRRRIPTLYIVAGAGATILACAGGLAAWLTFGPAPAAAAPISIVIADVQNRTGDPVFDQTLEKALRIDLAQSPRMNVLTRGQVANTLDLMTRPKGTAVTGAVADEVCARNNARGVVEESIARLGSRYLLTLSATSCSGGKTYAEEKEIASGREEVIPALDRLTARVRSRLGEAKASIDQFDTPLMPERTASIDALKALTVANDLSTAKGKDAESIPYFERAIALDPQFARAYAGLAAAYYNLSQTDKQIINIKKAYALRANVDRSLALNIETLYASEYTNDYDAVIRASTLMARLYPSAGSAWVNLANAENWIGRPEAAIAPARQAVVVAPKGAQANYMLSLALMQAGRLDEAHAVLAKAAATGVPGGGLIEASRYLLAVAQGDDAEADRIDDAARDGAAEAIVLPCAASNAYRLGRVRQGDGDYRRLSEAAAKQKSDDSAAIEQAREQFEVGHTAQAVARLATTREAADPPNYLLAESEFGDPATARAVLARQLAAGPSDTLLNGIYAPQARAHLDLRAGHPVAAIAELEKALPYELHDTEVPYLRGAAYLADHDGAHAAAEFRKIIDRPGLAPNAPQHALALVGLARALHLQNDLAGSRRSYEAFLHLWSKADPDTPLLIQVRREYAGLGRTAP